MGVITGSGAIKGFWKQPTRWGRNESGNWQVWPFEGTANEIRQLAGLFASTPGLAYEVSESFGKFRLEVHFPWNADGVVDPTTDILITWELFAEHAEKHLLEAQTNTGIISTISTNQKEVIRQRYQNPPDPNNGQDPTTAVQFAEKTNGGQLPAGDGSDPTGANSLKIYKLLIAGGTGYAMEAPRLRRTMVTSNKYAIAYSLTNVRKILATSYIAAHEGLDPNLLFNITSYTAADVSTDAKLAFGWYKPFPSIQQIALLKWQITQEWHYGWWAVDTYGQPFT